MIYTLNKKLEEVFKYKNISKEYKKLLLNKLFELNTDEGKGIIIPAFDNFGYDNENLLLKSDKVKIPFGIFYYDNNIIVNKPKIEESKQELSKLLNIDINNKKNYLNLIYNEDGSYTLNYFNNINSEKKTILFYDLFELLEKLNISKEINLSLETWIDYGNNTGNEWLIYNLETEQYSFKQENYITENDVKLYQINKENLEIIKQEDNKIDYNIYKNINCASILCNEQHPKELNIEDEDSNATYTAELNNVNIDEFTINNKPIKINNNDNNSLELIEDGFFSNSSIEIPVGFIIYFAGNDENYMEQKGYLFCDGRTLNKNEYLDLFNIIGYTYGGSNDEFKLPDLRELVLVGAGQNSTHNIASHDIYEVGKFKDDQIKNHTHKVGGLKLLDNSTYNGKFASNKTWWCEIYTNITSKSSTKDSYTTHSKQIGLKYFIKAKYL